MDLSQMFGILAQFVNLGIVAAIVVVVEFIKPYIPDIIEPKLIPIFDLVIGVILSIVFNGGNIQVVDGTIVLHPVFSLYTIVVGLSCGMAASAGYGLVMKTVSKVGGN